ncbi:MAG: CidA/LrgA family protein [Verrucomicrobiales bacterium]
MKAITPSTFVPLVRTGLPLRWIQTLGLIGVWWLAETFTRATHCPIPGSLVGLIALWILLDCGVLRLDWFEHGADGLLNHLMLFFVPAMLAIVNHPEFVSLLGLKVLMTVLGSTLMVMGGTACIVEFGFRLSHASAR